MLGLRCADESLPRAERGPYDDWVNDYSTFRVIIDKMELLQSVRGVLRALKSSVYHVVYDDLSRSTLRCWFQSTRTSAHT